MPCLAGLLPHWDTQSCPKGISNEININQPRLLVLASASPALVAMDKVESKSSSIANLLEGKAGNGAAGMSGVNLNQEDDADLIEVHVGDTLILDEQSSALTSVTIRGNAIAFQEVEDAEISREFRFTIPTNIAQGPAEFQMEWENGDLEIFTYKILPAREQPQSITFFELENQH